MAAPKGTSFLTVLAVLAVLVFSASLTPAAAQTVIFVDASATGAGGGSSWADAYTAVQPALNAAQPGDQVWVAAGTYVENITLALGVGLYGGFAGTEDPATFNLADRHLTANQTILDGNRNGSVVTSPSGATNNTRIDGFTIRNGSGPYGGGIHCDSSSPTIANDTVTGNATSYVGGGVYLHNSSPTVVNTTVANNFAFREGGGMYLHSASATMDKVRISGNFAECGGGLFVGYSTCTITDSTIADNRAAATAPVGGLVAGGGLYSVESAPTIANCRISNNAVLGNQFHENDGGGLCLVLSPAVIANNTLTGNSAPRFGGGMYVKYSSAIIVNNTVTGNRAIQGGGCFSYSAAPAAVDNLMAFNSSGVHRIDGTLTLRHNCVFGNDEYNYSGFHSDPTGTDGNISVDPRFVQTPDPGPDGVWGTPDDDPGDVHLLPGSPGIDAGDNAYAFGDFDLDGLPRIAWCNVDIGAHEYPGPFGDFFGDCDVDLEDYALLEVCLRFSGPDALPPFDECLEVFDFDLDFDVDLTDFAVFQLVFTHP
jgi:hypothetical protein